MKKKSAFLAQFFSIQGPHPQSSSQLIHGQLSFPALFFKIRQQFKIKGFKMTFLENINRINGPGYILHVFHG